MSIPLERLYNYIQDMAEKIYDDNVVIYLFFPHGSKNIEDLNVLRPTDKSFLAPEIICYDQEPLNFNLYQNLHKQISTSKKIKTFKPFIVAYYQANQKNLLVAKDRNLRYWYQNIFDKAILLHSEKNSIECKKYQENDFIPVYYWSHAIIALDWYRYAQYVEFTKNKKTKLFLIYNRAWSGTREYRLKFCEQIIELELKDFCQITFSAFDNEKHYQDHKFSSLYWKPTLNLENYFDSKQICSSASADFEIEDYKNTQIEVVLETLFEDSRWHLTEKTLRPIACGQPFLLVSTPNSLKYLKSYGFKTFEDIWDESYDDIQDHATRLNTITEQMKKIAQWSPDQRKKQLDKAQRISQFNRRHFFSKKFYNIVINELKNNLSTAFDELQLHKNGQIFYNAWKQVYEIEELVKVIEANSTHKVEILEVIKKIEKLHNTKQTKK